MAKDGHPATSSEGSVTGGQLVVELLQALGVRFVFGVPGGQTLAITDALRDSNPIRFIAARHEGAAACMADAIGRLTMNPGVCLATTGPGATNMITGIGGAFRELEPGHRDHLQQPSRRSRQGRCPGRRPHRDLSAAGEMGEARRRRPDHSPGGRGSLHPRDDRVSRAGSPRFRA